MIDIDFFTYRKEPIVKINHIGIYPLDDKGRAKYYSKDSYTHHFLHRTDPSVIEQNIKNKYINEDEENKINEETLKNQDNLNTLENKKTYEGLQTEPNQNYDNSKISLRNNNTISTSRNHETLNQKYLKNMNQKKKLKKINLKYQSHSKTKTNHNITLDTEENKKEKEPLKLMKTFNNSGHRKLAQSFDKNARLTGLKSFKMAKVNNKLPLIMGGFNHGKSYIIRNIRTGSKEMGENYNPYNFICPHVNRTKRNYVGGLFHC